MIRRFQCQNCHSYHNELPDCLVPYKHYEAEVIAGVLDEVILPEDLDSEDYPSFNTMLRREVPERSVAQIIYAGGIVSGTVK